jgi:copper(I)-binding protein
MRYLIGIAIFLCTLQAWASDIVVSGAWARATAPGQDSGSIELLIQSKKAAKLVAVASHAAGTVELHSMAQENGKMVMRAVEFIDLPAGKKVRLGGNYHIMLTNLKSPLKEGKHVPFTLTVEFADKRRETIEGAALIKPLSESHEMDDMGGMHGMEGMKGM